MQKVTVWGWYPAIEKVVDQFNETHDDLQVCWNNGGQGGGEYTKFQNAIKAGSGAPDVIQLEYEAMPQFMTGTQQHLVDLSQFGFNDHKDDYTEGSWDMVKLGAKVNIYSASEQVWNLVTSGSLISVIPMVLAFLFLQKYWVGGLTAGSVKS